MTAEADTRCWQTLPSQLHIYALSLPLGPHELTSTRYLYFQEHATFQRDFTLTNERDIAVIVLPPTEYELYFRHDELKMSRRDQAEIENASAILIPPPTGLDDIIRVVSSDGETALEAVAPDPKRFMRTVLKALTSKRIPGALVSHERVIQSRHSLAEEHGRALQCQLIEISREGDRKSGAYRTKLRFSLIDTQTGQTLLSETHEGVSPDIKSGPTTGFYTCIQAATETFLRSIGALTKS